jgi:hypothetical protein
MTLYKATLYGLSSNLALNTDGYALSSEVIANQLSSIEFECFELNFEYDKLSEVREANGGLNKDDNTYKEGFTVVTDRYELPVFGSLQSQLINVLRREYKYVMSSDYEFVPFSSTLAMPFEVESYGIEHSSPHKWYNLKLVKSNAK